MHHSSHPSNTSRTQDQTAAPPPELIIVMPVFNEQASVRKVVTEWFHEVENWTEQFVFLAINDGSKDNSASILNRLRDQLGVRLQVVDQKNKGHGQTCLEGYHLAYEMGAPYVMQIDSDGQCDPQYFFRLWRDREKFDVIYGVRTRRDDGWRRVLASWVLRFTLLASTRCWCPDANVPYRLMKTEKIRSHVGRLPSDFFLANVGLAVLLKKDRSIRHGYVPIRFRERYGGEPSVRLGMFGGKALELLRQLGRKTHRPL